MAVREVAVRIWIAIGLAAVAAACTAGAGNPAEPIRYRVNVRIRTVAELPAPLLWGSEDGATTIFAKTGIQLTWRSKSGRECGSEPAMRDITMVFVSHAPPSVAFSALAMAMPSADSGLPIVIFYERVKSLLGHHQAQRVAILSYVLAHEIMHVLQGVAHHSEAGIMRARWTEYEFARMSNWELAFTPEDVQLIRRRLEDERITHVHQIPAS